MVLASLRHLLAKNPSKIPPPPSSTSSEQWPAVSTSASAAAAMVSSEMSSVGFSGPHHSPLLSPYPILALGFNHSAFMYEELAAAIGSLRRRTYWDKSSSVRAQRGVGNL
ncbi:non-specific serine,threonine protein kinase [Sarracenia purpurea var. burkii]